MRLVSPNGSFVDLRIPRSAPSVRDRESDPVHDILWAFGGFEIQDGTAAVQHSIFKHYVNSRRTESWKLKDEREMEFIRPSKIVMRGCSLLAETQLPTMQIEEEWDLNRYPTQLNKRGFVAVYVTRAGAWEENIDTDWEERIAHASRYRGRGLIIRVGDLMQGVHRSSIGELSAFRSDLTGDRVRLIAKHGNMSIFPDLTRTRAREWLRRNETWDDTVGHSWKGIEH
jgi:hypothetical protein